MVNNKIVSTLLTLCSLSLLSCGAVEKGSTIHVPSIPKGDSSSVSFEPDSQTTSVTTPKTSSSEDTSVDQTNHIEVEDLADFYYVGETFIDVYRLKLTLFYNGTESDISERHSSLLFYMKDSNDATVDVKKPFKTPGKYKFHVGLTRDTSIVSPDIEITVKEPPSKILNQKSTIPSGFTYKDFEDSCLDNLSLPTLGQASCLVVPVEIPDYPFAEAGYGEDYLDAINRVFNGNGSADTGYWESVSSYYRKSSMGQLNLRFEIAEVLDAGAESGSLMGMGTWGAFDMAKKALDAYKTVHGADSVKRFDYNQDGYVDGIWLVYSAPDYSKGVYGGAYGEDLFWAFCADYPDLEASLSSPELHSFGWASIDFFLEGTTAPNVDAHTIIHETGHLLSLPDYYSYDLGGSNASGAQGGLAMMDLNIGDQDAFSKMALGWSNPYVPTEDCVITLRPNESSGDCIVLANSWNGTAFDEYILLDLQTPTGLNALDSQKAYNGRPPYYSEPGVRVYHVDARLGEFKYYGEGENPDFMGIGPVKHANSKDYYVMDEDVRNLLKKGGVDSISKDLNVPLSSRSSGFTVINANSTTRSKIAGAPYNSNRLLTLVGADGKHPEIDGKVGSNTSLFQAGSSWTVNGKTLRFFSNEEGVFNNGDDFNYVFSVLSCSSEEAKIQVRRIGK